jgi:hypothetical protein
MYCAAHDGCRGQQGLDGLDFTPPSSDGSWCGTTCRRLVGSAIVGGIFIAVGEHNDWWRNRQGPDVTSDDADVTCTGDPCPGAPTVGAKKVGGLSFAFPIR